MTAPSKIGLGSVIWAELADANGVRKLRPSIILSSSEDIVMGKPLRLAAVTTRIPFPLPEDHVLLPWDRMGRARSGLRKKCAAITTWLAEIALTDVQQVVGMLPPMTIAKILSKLSRLNTPPLPEETTEPPTSP